MKYWNLSCLLLLPAPKNGVSDKMVIDVISLMKKSNSEVLAAYDRAYPSSTLDSIEAIRSLNQISGIMVALKSCLDSRIKEEDDLEKEEWEKINPPVDYFAIFNFYIYAIENAVTFYRKTAGSEHGQLQRISGLALMMKSVLDSIKVAPDEI